MGNKSKQPFYPPQKGDKSTVVAAYTRSAPLPAPEELERFEQILPGATERIFKQFENQAAHRQKLEKRVITTESINSFVGLIFGFIIGMTGLLGGIYLVLNNHESAGCTIG